MRILGKVALWPRHGEWWEEERKLRFYFILQMIAIKNKIK